MNMRIVLGFFIIISLSGCTLITEYKVKKIAIDFIIKQYENTYRAEMKSEIGEFHLRGNDFVGFVLRHTTAKVDGLTMVDSNYYQVELTVKAFMPCLAIRSTAPLP